MMLVPINPKWPTAYVHGGGVRISGDRPSDRQVPPLNRVLTIGDAPSGGWRLARRVADQFEALQEHLVSIGAEPIRITDAYRDQHVQARAREEYERWIAAGRPRNPGPGQKAAYVARPNESHHGWGGAVDIDVEALSFPGIPMGSDDALAALWEAMDTFGWSPIIAHPLVHQSEAWHIECLSPELRAVYAQAAANNVQGYPYTARVGCAVQGTISLGTPERNQIAYVQARLALEATRLASTAWPGPIDGLYGAKTRAALMELTGLDLPPLSAKPITSQDMTAMVHAAFGPVAEDLL